MSSRNKLPSGATGSPAQEPTQLLVLAELEGQSTLLENIESELTEVNAELDGHTGSLSAIEAALGDIESEIQSVNSELQGVNTELDTQTTALGNLLTETQKLTAVKKSLHTAFVDFSDSNLPGNATNPMQLVASASAAITEVQVFDTGGSFMELMVGTAGNETRVALLGPGMDSRVKVDIAASSRISVRRVDSATPASEGAIAFNFVG